MIATKPIGMADLLQVKHDDPSGLQLYLRQLVGEEFRFARISYGDELTLHFGAVRPARSPKLKGKMYGSYILGMRGSSWLIKVGEAQTTQFVGGLMVEPTLTAAFRLLSNADFEAENGIQPGCRVLLATAFAIRHLDSYGLQLTMSDGTTTVVMPKDAPEEEKPIVGLENPPEIATWDLLSPLGLLNAGPGMKWSFEPTEVLDRKSATKAS